LEKYNKNNYNSALFKERQQFSQTYFNSYEPEGRIIGSLQNRELLNMGKAGLEKAMLNNIILESTALMCDSDMNLHIDLHGIIGIIPRNEVCFPQNGESIKDIAIITRVGKPVCFKVMSVEERDGKVFAYLSRRAAQIDCINNYISDLIPGDIIKARVTHLENFGAFVDIGCGIVSLLAVDCISISRFSHPSDRLYCGMGINVIVKSIDADKCRIFVSMRELLGTWEENAALFSVGQTVAGVIRSIESYGVFVELTPNLAGLAEFKGDTRYDSFESGRMTAVYIKSIIPEKMKIKLVLIDSYKGDMCLPSLSPKYFIDCEKVSHIDIWKYSPSVSSKLIETNFAI